MKRRPIWSGVFYGALTSVLAMAVLAVTGARFVPRRADRGIGDASLTSRR
jgi:hypothetical protein